MGGGLVQIAVYGSEDIFLTGTPQITFFKVVYRRHTNFAIEPIQQHFIGVPNFDQEMTSIIDKIGDLMSKVYLEIDLPKVDLIKNSSHWKNNISDAKIQLENIQKYYQLVTNYISLNTKIIRKLDTVVGTNNISMIDIEKMMANPNFINELLIQRQQLQTFIANNNDFEELVDKKLYMIQQINRFDIHILFGSIINDVNYNNLNLTIEEYDQLIKKEIKRIIRKSLYNEMHDFYMKIYNIFTSKQELYQSFLDATYTERYKFAWVEEIGHAIIDQIEIKIGNQVMDKHTGDWLILFNKIYIDEYQIENYNKLIGNITKLTIFDDNIKNTYKLVIPLRFWFCRHIGLSIPLIALRYHDVMFTVKFKDLSKLCYVEDTPNLMDILNIQSQYNINIIDAKLYVDYIYLDTEERNRFAQSTHEYLIETVQFNNFHDITGKQFNAHMDFAHPTKFIIWFVQPNSYRENPSGRNKCQWNNFGVNPNKTGHPMKSAYLRLNSCNRTDANLGMNFYNYMQPYLYFRRSPTDGFNIYSFAIEPMEHQPSSSINLSRIDDFGIVVSFTDDFIKLMNDDKIDGIIPGCYMGTYVVSYNIFRVMSGMGGKAFEYK